METILNFFESLFKNFTWSRLSAIAAILTISAGGFVAYELYSNNIKLKRVESELRIVSKIIDLENKVSSLPENSPSKKYFNRLVAETEEPTSKINLQFGFPSKKIERIFFQSLPWLIFLTLVFLTTSNGRGSALAGVSMIACPFIVIGYNLPSTDQMWIINYRYPWGTITAIFIAILWAQSRKKNKPA